MTKFAVVKLCFLAASLSGFALSQECQCTWLQGNTTTIRVNVSRANVDTPSSFQSNLLCNGQTASCSSITTKFDIGKISQENLVPATCSVATGFWGGLQDVGVKRFITIIAKPSNCSESFTQQVTIETANPLKYVNTYLISPQQVLLTDYEQEIFRATLKETKTYTITAYNPTNVNAAVFISKITYGDTTKTFSSGQPKSSDFPPYMTFKEINSTTIQFKYFPLQIYDAVSVSLIARDDISVSHPVYDMSFEAVKPDDHDNSSGRVPIQSVAYLFSTLMFTLQLMSFNFM